MLQNSWVIASTVSKLFSSNQQGDRKAGDEGGKFIEEMLYKSQIPIFLFQTRQCWTLYSLKKINILKSVAKFSVQIHKVYN